MKKIKKYIKEIISFFILLFIMSNAISLYKSSKLDTSSLDISDVTLIDNKAYSLDNSKPLMIHFWATWCPICKAEASNIQRISEHFQVISVAVQSGNDIAIKEYQEKNNINFMVINDKESTFANQLGVSVFPTTLIYNKNKQVVFSDVGYTSTWSLFLKMLWVNKDI